MYVILVGRAGRRSIYETSANIWRFGFGRSLSADTGRLSAAVCTTEYGNVTDRGTVPGPDGQLRLVRATLYRPSEAYPDERSDERRKQNGLTFSVIKSRNRIS